MNTLQFADKATQQFKAVFPNGFVQTRKLFSGDIGFTFSLTEDIKDCPHQIRENDRMMLSFVVHDLPFGSDVDQGESKFELEFYRSHISTIPVSHYYAMGHQKIKTRKGTNTLDKLLKTLDKYFKLAGSDVLALVAENKIYQQDQMNTKYFEINVK
jgi:hypothetical protein